MRQTWREPLLNELPNIELVLTIGLYAQQFHLGKARKKNLTETVKDWQSHIPNMLPLPHPSPRNNIWLKRNPWFEQQVIPYLKTRVSELL